MDQRAADAVGKLDHINGEDNLWFVGAYSIYGIPLLESAVLSAYRVVEKLGGKPPRITPFPSAPSADKKESTIAAFLPGAENQYHTPQPASLWRPFVLVSAGVAVAAGVALYGPSKAIKHLIPATSSIIDYIYAKFK